MTKLFTFLFILSLPLTLFAQINIKGKVVDRSTNEPIAGATVYISNTSYKTVADAFGNFEMQ